MRKKLQQITDSTIKDRKVRDLHKHPFAVPVITFFVLFILSAVAFVGLGSSSVAPTDSRVVQLYVEGEKRVLPTRAQTVGDLLQRLDIKLGEHDVVEPVVDAAITDDNFSINVYRAHPVTIVDQATNKETVVMTAQESPHDIARQAGLTVYPEDRVEIRPPDDIVNEGVGEKVVIDRATPAGVNLYGNQIAVRTRAKTVGEVLTEKNIKPIEGDTVTPAPETPIAVNTQIFVTRLGKQVDTREEAIPAPTETINDASLAMGSTKVREAGNPGKKLVTYEIELKNGREVSRKPLQEVVAIQPVTKVVLKGTKPSAVITGTKADWIAAAGLSPDEYAAADFIISRESGWCPTKWQGERGACPAYHGSPTSASVGYGLCQSTPGWKMATAGADWATNPVTQLRWCTNYARGKYGSWQAAYNFWVAKHWW